jgi:hypothetical protein
MLLSADFMLDEDLRLYLIEINARSAIQQYLPFMEQLFRELITEGLDIVVEVEIKRTCGVSLGGLSAPRTWEPLWNEDVHPGRRSKCFKQRPRSGSGGLY